jgi:two-component system, OmpR family, osmolarity sensor histidine kinase EnvZ
LLWQPRSILPRTLFWRSVLIIVVPIILVQVVVVFILFDRHWDLVARRLSSGVAGDVTYLVRRMTASPNQEVPLVLFAELGAAKQLIVNFAPAARFADRAPASFATSAIDGPLLRAISERLSYPVRLDTTSLGREVRIEVELDHGILDVRVPRELLFTTTTYLVVIWMAVASFIVILIALLFMRNQVRPIRRLAIAADLLGKGREVPRFQPSGATEVRQAAAAFNLMRERIQQQLQQRTDMLAGVSHDLRTPLTRMKLELEFMPRRPEVMQLKGDVEDMQRMIEGYLSFARSAGTDVSEPTEATDIAALLTEIVAQARRSGGTIELASIESVSLQVRRDAVRRCLTNLIENGMRYGEKVWVVARRTPGAVEIAIEDDGPGIAPDKREEVFRPFFRLDPSRNRETGGVGLGLTIARDVARSHGGDVTLEDSSQGGLKAVLRLPF